MELVWFRHHHNETMCWIAKPNSRIAIHIEEFIEKCLDFFYLEKPDALTMVFNKQHLEVTEDSTKQSLIDEYDNLTIPF